MSKGMPKLLFMSGEQVSELRRELGHNQTDFWGRIMVTQSGGSRYENGRDMPQAVRLLLNLTYAPRKQASALFEYLRREKA